MNKPSANLQNAIQQLNDANLDGDDQEALRRQTLEFCKRHPDALKRTCLEGHLTASAAVIRPATSELLLVHHSKLDRWLQPGGHADGDANLDQVAWREASEETGLEGLSLITPAIDIDIHTIPARGNEPEHLHFDLRFVVLADQDHTPKPNHEVLDAAWVRLSDPRVLASVELSRLARRAMALGSAMF